MTDPRFPPLASQSELDHEDMSNIQTDLNMFDVVGLAAAVLIFAGLAYLIFRVLT